MSLTLHLSSFTRKQFYRRLQEAYTSGSLKLVKPIHALLALSQGQSVCEVADMLALGEQNVRNYRNQDLFNRLYLYNQLNARSTIHLLGKTTNPFMSAERLTISRRILR
ncbi:hypothetical protein C2W62_34430 [Candidatus Entotheonella serta]|nr:hypothetical protein C2W62_34430 [Candidatus Entotheonella serta]